MFMMRVMPVMSAIENNTKTASWHDEIATLIENATAISVWSLLLPPLPPSDGGRLRSPGRGYVPVPQR